MKISESFGARLRPATVAYNSSSGQVRCNGGSNGGCNGGSNGGSNGKVCQNVSGGIKTRVGSIGVKLLLSLLLAMALLPVMPQQNAFADSITVSNYSDLAAAIQGANDGDVITLAQNIDVPNGGSFYADAVAARAITIIGDGHTLRQTGSKSMFSFGYGDITFINVKFDGNSKPASDEVGDGGSAIYSFKAKITVLDCTFFNCFTNGDLGGGAICMYSSGGVLNVNGCLFSGNKSLSYDGGAIYAYVGSGMIANSTFVNNHADYSGGAIRTEYGNVAITNCTLYNNEAYDDGGAVSDYASDSSQKAVIKNTIAIGNIAGGSAGQDVHYGWPGATDGGNNLFGSVTNLSLNSSSSANINNSAGWLDTTLKNNGGLTMTLALLEVSGGIAGNPAIDKGVAGSGVPTYDQRGVARDSTPDIGAYEYVPTPPPVVTGVTISPVSLVAGKGDTRVFAAEVLGQNGPSPDVVWSVSGAASANTTIALSGTAADGKKLGTLSIAPDETAAQITVTATSVEDSAFYASSAVTVVSEFDVTNEDEYSNAMLSALNPLVINLLCDIADVDAPSITDLREVVINGNGFTLTQADGGVSARLEAVIPSGGSGAGGLADNRLSVNDLTIVGGAATNYKNGGGAIYLASGNVFLNNVTITDCKVKYDGTQYSNKLKFGGGAVSVALNPTSNSSLSNGSITATNCTFTSNEVGPTMDNYGGGALCADLAFLTNCTFYGNATLDRVGGAIYTRLGGTMVNCTVVNNYAGLVGGGVAGRTNEVNGNNSRMQILNCIIAGNKTATANGSGVNVDQVYDQGGNIFGYIRVAIDATANYRDKVWSAGGERVPAAGSLWNIAENDADLLNWLELGAPINNGGATPTIALIDVLGSIAIDKGVTTGISTSNWPALSSPAKDQRGVSRDALPDVGAYELSGARVVDKSYLQQLVNDANALTEDDYTATSWQDLTDAVNAAQAVLADPNATQAEVDDAIIVLEAAISALVLKSTGSGGGTGGGTGGGGTGGSGTGGGTGGGAGGGTGGGTGGSGTGGSGTGGSGTGGGGTGGSGTGGGTGGGAGGGTGGGGGDTGGGDTGGSGSGSGGDTNGGDTGGSGSGSGSGDSGDGTNGGGTGNGEDSYGSGGTGTGSGTGTGTGTGSGTGSGTGNNNNSGNGSANGTDNGTSNGQSGTPATGDDARALVVIVAGFLMLGTAVLVVSRRIRGWHKK
ncbi:MAG: FIVAR domain-containing protein [Coriobacteriales bacterium]|nr:FIVAR domain-containing protein [Coriobacteriales bacterium]